MKLRKFGPAICMFLYFLSDAHLFGTFVTLLHFEIFTTPTVKNFSEDKLRLFKSGCDNAKECTLWDIEKELYHFYKNYPRIFTTMIKMTNDNIRVKRILSYCKY